MTDGRPAVLAEGLEKSYGKTRALDGLDLRAEGGTVLGLLGPNGAGKTTAVRIFTTLLKPDAGYAEVAGRPAIAFGDDSGLGALVLRQDPDGVTVVGGRIGVSRAIELADRA